ncbi:MAG: hypothetical protein HYZ75_16480 [Elusimicrobia bacterium]|nr:hypothetical protein [Elusimicrobiota bacterium]
MDTETQGRHKPLAALEAEIDRLEARLRGSADDLTRLRAAFALAAKAQQNVRHELAEIRDTWEDLHYQWWWITLTGVLALFVCSYFFYTNLGWYADQRVLPPGSDALLDKLPTLNLLPLLSWGWMAAHLYAAVHAILYYPRKMPFLLFLLGSFIGVRSVFVFLSPMGAPAGMLDMSKLDYVFSRIMGTYTFQNEFVFSGHTGIPFLFSLFFESKLHKRLFLGVSIVMAAACLLTRNHYSVDILGAYFMGYAIFVLSRDVYFQRIRPIFLKHPIRDPLARP